MRSGCSQFETKDTALDQAAPSLGVKSVASRRDLPPASASARARRQRIHSGCTCGAWFPVAHRPNPPDPKPRQSPVSAWPSDNTHEITECAAHAPAGLDLLPLLLAGHGGGGGDADFSGFYTALLWSGQHVVSAVLLRAFGPALAEVPFLATRPQSQV